MLHVKQWRIWSKAKHQKKFVVHLTLKTILHRKKFVENLRSMRKIHFYLSFRKNKSKKKTNGVKKNRIDFYHQDIEKKKSRLTFEHCLCLFSHLYLFVINWSPKTFELIFRFSFLWSMLCIYFFSFVSFVIFQITN